MMDEELEGLEESVLQQIIFRVGGNLFSVSSEYMQGITSLPDNLEHGNDNPYVLGMCDFSGSVITVVDTKAVLHLVQTRRSETGRESRRLMLVLNEKKQVGILADAVVAVKSEEDCTTLNNSLLVSDIVKSNFLAQGIDGIIMELDVPMLISEVE